MCNQVISPADKNYKCTHTYKSRNIHSLNPGTYPSKNLERLVHSFTTLVSRHYWRQKPLPFEFWIQKNDQERPLSGSELQHCWLGSKKGIENQTWIFKHHLSNNNCVIFQSTKNNLAKVVTTTSSDTFLAMLKTSKDLLSNCKLYKQSGRNTNHFTGATSTATRCHFNHYAATILNMHRNKHRHRLQMYTD